MRAWFSRLRFILATMYVDRQLTKEAKQRR